MVKSLLSSDKKVDAALVALVSSSTNTNSESFRAGRVGLWALLIGFGGFLLWAGLAPLDEGVPAAGIVAIDT